MTIRRVFMASPAASVLHRHAVHAKERRPGGQFAREQCGKRHSRTLNRKTEGARTDSPHTTVTVSYLAVSTDIGSTPRASGNMADSVACEVADL
jgi:hypothetical protein